MRKINWTLCSLLLLPLVFLFSSHAFAQVTLPTVNLGFKTTDNPNEVVNADQISFDHDGADVGASDPDYDDGFYSYHHRFIFFKGRPWVCNKCLQPTFSGLIFIPDFLRDAAGIQRNEHQRHSALSCRKKFRKRRQLTTRLDLCVNSCSIKLVILTWRCSLNFPKSTNPKPEPTFPPWF